MRKVLAVLIVTLCAACAPSLPRYSVPPDAAPTGFYEDQQRPDLALLEFRLASYFARDDRPYETVCAVDGSEMQSSQQQVPVALDADIERKLLRRFASLTPASGCKREGLSVMDSDTGVEAALFDVHDLECESAVKCSAWGGYYANGQHGWKWYWLEWRGGNWQIRERDLGIVLT